MSARRWAQATAAPAPAADGKPNMAKRYGFKETREEREAREMQEKKNKWEDRLQKEDLVKLEAELESLLRARFLAPQQKVRKNLVEKMVRDLRSLHEKQSKENASHPECADYKPDVAPRLSRDANENDDDDVDILRDMVEVETLNTSQLQFVPRHVKRRPERVAVTASTAPTDHAKMEEEKLLKAMAEHPDDFDDILDSI